jgi:hypothetical protein
MRRALKTLGFVLAGAAVVALGWWLWTRRANAPYVLTDHGDGTFS